MKKIHWVILILVVVFFFPKSYISSAGHVTAEMNTQFEMTRKQCAGFSVLTNAEAMAADAPGKNLCFGWLY
jgi:Na+-transporting NADH:ubiquinone oxidoreductase subunit NqrF